MTEIAKEDRIVEKPSDIEKFRLKEGENSFDFTGVTFQCRMNFSGMAFTDVLFENVVFEKDVDLTKLNLQ